MLNFLKLYWKKIVAIMGVFLLVLAMLLGWKVFFPPIPSLGSTTETFTSTTSDCYIYNYGTDYSTVRTAATGTVYAGLSYAVIGQAYDETNYYIYRSFFYFNTSSIPDSATIDSGKLQLYGYVDQSNDDFQLAIYIDPNDVYPHDPAVSGDYALSNYDTSTLGGNLYTGSFVVDAYNNITLNSDGLDFINKTGWTKLCVFSQSDVNGIAPTDLERVYVQTAEESGKEPKLEITYTSDTDPPTYSNVGTNTTVISTTCKFFSYWEDDTELDYALFSWNASGSMSENETVFANAGVTAKWANITKTLPATDGLVIKYVFYCNDTLDQWNSTSNTIRLTRKTVFLSEASIDGFLTKYGENWTACLAATPEVHTTDLAVWCGSGDDQPYEDWNEAAISYISFDTSNLTGVSVSYAILKWRTTSDNKWLNGTGEVVIRGNGQPIYGNSLDANDWNSTTLNITTWSVDNWAADTWFSYTIPSAYISSTNRTQFEVTTNKLLAEESPAGNYYWEFQFYSGDSETSYGWAPRLEVHWYSHTNLTTGWNWLYALPNDIGHTLGEINISIWNDGVQFTVISKYNGTYYTFIRNYSLNVNIKILEITDIIFIYCNATGGIWKHEY